MISKWSITKMKPQGEGCRLEAGLSPYFVPEFCVPFSKSLHCSGSALICKKGTCISMSWWRRTWSYLENNHFAKDSTIFLVIISTPRVLVVKVLIWNLVQERHSTISPIQSQSDSISILRIYNLYILMWALRASSPYQNIHWAKLWFIWQKLSKADSVSPVLYWETREWPMNQLAR